MATRPLRGTPTITQSWGEPSSLYRKGYHTGVDYGVANNTPVISPTNGVITQAYDGRAASDGRGFFLRIRGNDGVEHNLYHLARWHVSSGNVSEGQHIADSDNTGLSTGSHLHWETRRAPYDGSSDFNPADWLYAPVPPPPITTPSIPGNARVLENKDGVYQRAEPKKGAAIIKDWPYDTTPFEFKGFVRGDDPYGNGNNIWFVGKYSGGYFWSGAFIDKGTHDLPDQTPSPTPIPVPDPTPIDPTPSPQPEMPVDFKPDDASVIATYKTLNQGIVVDGKTDRTKTQVPKFIVIHQWDDPAKKPTREGVIAHFQDKKVEVSAHYIVDDSGVYQMVPENKRAWHAGVKGNDGIGIECDPNGGEAMYAALRLLVANIRVRWNKLEIKKHSDFMATECPKYINVLRIEPVTVPPNSTDYGKENNDLLKQILALLQNLISKITSIFK